MNYKFEILKSENENFLVLSSEKVVLKEEKNLTYIFISHDLKIVKALSDKIMVMKAGKIIEFETKGKIFTKPKTPYTKKLLKSAFI